MTSRRDIFLRAIARGRRLRGAALMGVCNVTPDSFSDGGAYDTAEKARARVDALVAEGADVVDVGGESTRPGAKATPAAVQIDRILDVVRYAATLSCVSVDTTSAEVATACLAAGASIVNDVSLLHDPEVARVTAVAGGALVLSHARAGQDGMPDFGAYPEGAYGDVVDDVLREWAEAAARAVALGVPRGALIMDPGLGFTKSAAQSLELLRRTADLVARAGAPVLVGASRKSFLRIADPAAAPAERLGASLAAAVHAARAGATLLRVHDVRATHQAITMARFLADPGATDAVALPGAAAEAPSAVLAAGGRS